MLVRCVGNEEENECVRAWLRIRGRCLGMVDHGSWWQSSHPGNPKRSKERVTKWFQEQLKKGFEINRTTLCAPEKTEWFDEEYCSFRLWDIPEWPVSKILGKRSLEAGMFYAERRWVDRVMASIKKHGIKDPILAWGHIVKQRIYGPYDNDTPNIIMGSNRIAIAQHLGIPTVMIILSQPQKDKQGNPWKPKYEGTKLSWDAFHDMMRADVWVCQDDWQIVHPPTTFHDDSDDQEHDLDYGSDTLC